LHVVFVSSAPFSSLLCEAARAVSALTQRRPGSGPGLLRPPAGAAFAVLVIVVVEQEQQRQTTQQPSASLAAKVFASKELRVCAACTPVSCIGFVHGVCLQTLRRDTDDEMSCPGACWNQIGCYARAAVLIGGLAVTAAATYFGRPNASSEDLEDQSQI
jgi:hypothetical protein